jgi:hypothetical protein
VAGHAATTHNNVDFEVATTLEPLRAAGLEAQYNKDLVLGQRGQILSRTDMQN